MKIIRNKIIPFKGFKAINLFGVLFVRGNAELSYKLITHERIHTAQMKELLYIGFYILYLLEWLVKLAVYCNGYTAYRSISFEKEAYGHQMEGWEYLYNRKRFAQWRKD